MAYVNNGVTRAAIALEAFSWLSTPYHHSGRLKGIGVDCAMLPALVYHAVGLVPMLEPEYSPQWMLHHDEEQFLGWVRPHTREIARDEVKTGDMAMWKFGRTYSHSAIVIDPPTIIHAVAKNHGVILGNMDQDIDLTSRPVLFFSLFESE